MQAAAGPTQTAVEGAAEEWAARPFIAGASRFAIFLFPYFVGFITALVISQFWPASELGIHPLLWWAGLAFVSTVSMIPADRFIRRFIPLSGLLSVALTFPDEAPSRFQATMRSSTTAQVRRRVREAVATSERGAAVDRSQYMLDLVSMLTRHDRLTRGHSERVRAYATLVGQEMRLSKVDQQKLYWAALLHDVGKLDVPSAILNKQGKPTKEEWKVIQSHPAAGTKYLAPLRGWLGEWAEAAEEHHMRWDGLGYPRSVAGTNISLAGRIIAVADAYDVMTSARSYKAGMRASDARVELRKCAGGQFDPAVVRAFLNISVGRLRLAAGPLASLPVVLGTLVNGVAASGVKVVLIGSTIGAGVAASPIVEPPLTPELLAYVDEARDWLKQSEPTLTVVNPAAPVFGPLMSTSNPASTPAEASDAPLGAALPAQTGAPADTTVDASSTAPQPATATSTAPTTPDSTSTHPTTPDPAQSQLPTPDPTPAPVPVTPAPVAVPTPSTPGAPSSTPDATTSTPDQDTNGDVDGSGNDNNGNGNANGNGNGTNGNGNAFGKGSGNNSNAYGIGNGNAYGLTNGPDTDDPDTVDPDTDDSGE